MPDLFDKPQSKVQLSDREIRELAERIPSAYLRQFGLGVLNDAEILRRAFRMEVGGCTVLNVDRFLAVGKRLREGYTGRQLYQAIVAYGNELKTNAYRLANPSARRSFEGFLGCDRLDVYVAIGEQVVEDRELSEHEQTLRSLPTNLSSALLADAIRVLERSGPFKGDRKLSNPVVHREALRLLRDQAKRKESRQ